MALRRRGTVKYFNPDKGYGFITPADGTEDLFLHFSSIHSKGYKSVVEGEPVEFSTEYDERKRKACATCVTGPDFELLPGFSTAGYTIESNPGKPKPKEPTPEELAEAAAAEAWNEDPWAGSWDPLTGDWGMGPPKGKGGKGGINLNAQDYFEGDAWYLFDPTYAAKLPQGESGSSGGGGGPKGMPDYPKGGGKGGKGGKGGGPPAPPIGSLPFPGGKDDGFDGGKGGGKGKSSSTTMHGSEAREGGQQGLGSEAGQGEEGRKRRPTSLSPRARNAARSRERRGDDRGGRGDDRGGRGEDRGGRGGDRGGRGRSRSRERGGRGRSRERRDFGGGRSRGRDRDRSWGRR